jgi:hypothetical protein
MPCNYFILLRASGIKCDVIKTPHAGKKLLDAKV